MANAILTAGAGLLTTAFAGPGAGAAVATAVGSIGGGGRSVCPNQASPAVVSAVVTRASPQELAELRRLHALSNPSDPFNPSNPAYLAWQIAGGSDCKVSSASGKATAAYFAQLATKYATGPNEAPLSQAAIESTQLANAGVGEQTKRILDSVLNTGKEIVRSTVGGAIAGARGATQGAEVGAQVGSTGTQFLAKNTLPLVGIAAVGALAVVLFLVLRK